MHATYTYPRYAAGAAPEVGAAVVRRVPLVVIGAGPVGLCAAIDGALRGLPVLLLDDDDSVSLGSRGLCWAKRTLEIFDRLGVGDAVVAKGVTWNVGRTFHGEREVFNFNLLPDPDHRRPGMVNLQQYWVEQLLVERAQQLSAIDLRWKHRVLQVTPQDDGALIEVQSPAGNYTLLADWVVVADGARSPVRRRLGLDTQGQTFRDRFLIADVVLDGELFPADRTERWFWFDPPFHEGQSVLLHREADSVWRIDFQLGWDADPEAEQTPERVEPRIRALLDHQGFGHIGFKLEWVSVYTFKCQRMKRLRHGRLLFVGDAAHQVSPFGARGANSGVQDVDNLMWKLALVAQGRVTGTAADALLNSYDQERSAAADENIAASTRATDFITPKSAASKLLRQAVLSLAAQVPMGRALVNSGRLSVPCALAGSLLNTPDSETFEGGLPPGLPADDAPHPGGWLLTQLASTAAGPSLSTAGFTLLWFGSATACPAAIEALHHRAGDAVALQVLLLPLDGVAARRYAAQEGTAVLLRPDQHVAARWKQPDPATVRAALKRACGHAAANAGVTA